MARVEMLAIFIGLVLAMAFVAIRMGSVALGELDVAAAVFAMVAAWWGIALGIRSGESDTGEEDTI